jgi:hypothetical protein
VTSSSIDRFGRRAVQACLIGAAFVLGRLVLWRASGLVLLIFAGILLAILPSAGGVLGGLFGALGYVVLISFLGLYLGPQPDQAPLRLVEQADRLTPAAARRGAGRSAIGRWTRAAARARTTLSHQTTS